MIYIYCKGVIQINRAGIRIITENVSSLQYVELGYDSKRNLIALKMVEQRNTNSLNVCSGTFSAVSFLRKNNLLPSKPLHREIEAENDYYICKLSDKENS